MRSVLALGLLITLCATTNAATAHDFRSPGIQLRARQRFPALARQRLVVPKRFAVPGWTDEQTQYWLDNATVSAGLG